MVTIDGVKYMQGPVGNLGRMPGDWEHIDRLDGKGLYKDSRGNLWLVWVPLNSQWQHYQALCTQEQLLRDWS